jgi:hypothetical protein
VKSMGLCAAKSWRCPLQTRRRGWRLVVRSNIVKPAFVASSTRRRALQHRRSCIHRKILPSGRLCGWNRGIVRYASCPNKILSSFYALGNHVRIIVHGVLITHRWLRSDPIVQEKWGCKRRSDPQQDVVSLR